MVLSRRRSLGLRAHVLMLMALLCRMECLKIPAGLSAARRVHSSVSEGRVSAVKSRNVKRRNVLWAGSEFPEENKETETEEENNLTEKRWWQGEGQWWRSPGTPQKISFEVEDQRLLSGDMFTLLIVALLLGLTDAVSDASFVPNGGFAAPIPAVPHTLGTLVERLSEMGVAWVLSSLLNGGYTWSATATDESCVKCAIAVWTTHCSIRVILALILAVASHAPVDGIDLFRQMFFVLPIMAGFRVFYGRETRSMF